jgi:hypothetical protein
MFGMRRGEDLEWREQLKDKNKRADEVELSGIEREQ